MTTEIARQETKQTIGMIENRQWQPCTKLKRYTITSDDADVSFAFVETCLNGFSPEQC